jgi:hypothetical protein
MRYSILVFMRLNIIVFSQLNIIRFFMRLNINRYYNEKISRKHVLCLDKTRNVFYNIKIRYIYAK